MPYSALLTTITDNDTILLYVDNDCVRVGDHIGTWTDETDEQTNLPYCLPNGETIDDVADHEELVSELRDLGLDVDTDCYGVTLVAIED